MKTSFHFSLLRYVYDPLTQEFVNIGVVLYSPGHRFIKAIFTSRYSRISKMFGHIDGGSFRAITRHIEAQICEYGERLERGLLLDAPPKDLASILADILPKDDTSIRFAEGGVGITEDPAKSLDTLFNRYVARYETPSDAIRRDENDVWRSFQESLKSKRVLAHLVPKMIVAPDYGYSFKQAWKNGKWNIFQPVSFDLADEGSILEKANSWVGRTNSLSSSSEEFKLFLLLGEPTNPELGNAFQKAQNLLSKIPVEWEGVREHDAKQFAEQVEEEFLKHEFETQN